MADTKIRLELWASATTWSADQMCWLAMGIDPDKVDTPNISDKLNDRYTALSKDIQGILDTRYDGSKASRNLAPIDAVKLMDLGGVSFPEELVSTIHDLAPKEKSSPSGDTKKLKTLQRLVLGMAVDKYSHSPDDGAAGRVSRSIALLGLSISEGTIRAALFSALNELDQNEKNDLFNRDISRKVT